MAFINLFNSSLEDKANKDHTHPLQTNCDTVDNLHLLVLTQSEYDGLVRGLEKLNESKERTLSLHIRKLRQEFLPYHTDTYELLNKLKKETS